MTPSEPTEPDARLAEQLAALHSEFDSYRQRTSAEHKKARERGRDEAAAELLDIVDDCDRALSVITAARPAGSAHLSRDDDHVVAGVEQLLARALRHFAKLGYESVGAAGESFDPHIHEAVSVEAGHGPDGSILRVHRRGWEHTDGALIRPAMVTVLQGTAASAQDETPRRRRHRPATPTAADMLPSPAADDASPETAVADPPPPPFSFENTPPMPAVLPKRKSSPAVAEDYLCPYGIPGCKQDCPGCAPPPAELFGEEDDMFSEEHGTEF